MIRLSSLDERITSNDNIYITDNIEGGKFIPINFGGRLVNELGKQLLKAASEGDLKEIQKLLCEGAPFTADWLGTSPLHFAAQGNHLAVCETLVRAGISTNARTKVDRTPLHIAAYEGHLDVVNLLLKVETEIDCTDLLGMTPLHWAVQKEHFEVIETLLKFGARTDIANKFGLKPVDIAHQINREDIIEILEEEQHEEPRIATENLAIEMAAEDENILDAEASNKDGNGDEIEVDAASSDFRDDIQTIEINTSCEEQSDSSFSDSMRILREHGITLLPNDDDNNILSTVMESGHSVVLTDIGKQVLESVKASEEADDISRKNLVENQEGKDYITVTADQFLALATGASISKEQTPIIRQVYGKFLPKTIKRIVMKKNKLQPISPAPNILKQKVLNQGATVLQINQQPSDANEELENIRKQLAEANRTIEEYKQKLIRKEAEAESYKKQLNMLGFS